MKLEALGYVGIRTGHLDDWSAYAARFLGMQEVDRSATSAAFRMDDRRQRLLFTSDKGRALAHRLDTLQAQRVAQALADVGEERGGAVAQFLFAMTSPDERAKVGALLPAALAAGTKD